ncbi:hypothetical protein BH23THE1_BH23THE1_22700 [soil metagenome]
MNNLFSYSEFLFLSFTFTFTFIFFLLFLFSSDTHVVTLLERHEPNFSNYFSSAQGIEYDTLLLSVNTETSGGAENMLTSINNSNTFYTKGLLSTVLFADYSELNQNLSSPPSPPPPSLNQTSESTILYSFPKLVSGTWSLNVSRGLVTDFHSDFKLLTVNGIEKHFIEIANFQNSNGSSVTFDQFSNTLINGFADLKIDDKIFQSKFPLTIQIFGINTLVLTVKDETIGNIFYNNDLLGITDSFKNFEGEELLIFEEDE